MSLFSMLWIIVSLSLQVNAVSDNSPIIGIDLGTSFSCVGVIHNGKLEIIANDQGNRITPSFVALSDDGTLVGEAARNQAVINPINTVFQVKRIIGRRWSDPELQEDIIKFPFLVTESKGSGRPVVSFGFSETTLSPEQISGIVLLKMKQTAEVFVGQKITRAVITVPAYFNDAQRQATKTAAKIAGLDVMRIVNEPTAAAIAHGASITHGPIAIKQASGKEKKTILVFDLGGGTFDVSIVNIKNGKFKVLATNGDMHLGGEDFDNRVLKHFINIFNKKFWLKSETLSFQSEDPKVLRAIQRLRQEVENGKKGLSYKKVVRIDIDNLYEGNDFTEKLTRTKFEELNKDLFEKVKIPLQAVLKDANLHKTDISEVLLVGGSSRIPKIQQIVKDFFGNLKDPVQNINPDEAVALGAAILAGELAGEKIDILQDIIPKSLGISTCYNNDPNDCDNMDIIIPKNTFTSKADFTKPYTTMHDYQGAIDIQIYEGEDIIASKNNLLGKFTLTGLKLAPKGVTTIRVNFKVDDNGILHVTANEVGSNNRKTITITNDQHSLSNEDILVATKYVQQLEIEEIHDEL